MRACPHCGDTYQDFIDFCFKDGTVLVAGSMLAAMASSAGAAVNEGHATAVPASMTATPVPREARRVAVQRPSAPSAAMAAADGPVPEANRDGDGAPDDEEAPLPPSAVETAPIPRPARAEAAAAATLPSAAPAGPTDTDQSASSPPPPAASPVPGPRTQLLNTTPKAVTFAGEVVEPESSTMLFAGIGALLVGALMIVLGVGGVFWFSGMVGPDEEALPQPGRIVEPAPATRVEPAPVEPALVDPAPVEPAVVEAGAIEPVPVEPVPGGPVPGGPAPGEGSAPPPTPTPTPTPVPSRVPPVAVVAPEPPRPAPAAPSVQHLRFVSTPSGVEVDVAGTVKTTPFEVDLGPGTHRWSAHAKNRKPREESLAIDVATEQTKTVDVSLASETRTCFLNADGNVAEIRFDGRVIQAFTTDDLPIGVHTVKVTLASGDTASGTIDVPSPSASSQCRVSVAVSQVDVSP